MEEKDCKQKLVLLNRRRLTVDNVINIDGLDKDYVELSSDAGKIIIEGTELKIEELNQERKDVTIVGTVDSITYKNNNKSTTFISRRKK